MQNSPAVRKYVILILGCLTALSPFSIDMYLPAFPQMAIFFKSTVAEVSITLSSYFIGLASGQLFYGPLMDRFGRKKPLITGLLIYITASIGCAFSTSVETLMILRTLQALGGCSASVCAFATVRDLFSPQESARVLSTLILILGASPLLAPTVGGYMAVYFGWTSIFYTLAAGATILLVVVIKFLPESHKGDSSHILRPVPILKNYLSIIRQPQFYTFALSGALAFSGMFVYLAASPTIFMTIFNVNEQVYGWIFAFIAMGLVGMSQLNVLLMKRFSSESILRGAMLTLNLITIVFFFCAYNGWFNLYSVVITIFLMLGCMGLTNPNATALAMAPFGGKAGSASSMIGFTQMGLGSLASMVVGLLHAQELYPLVAIFAGTSTLAILTLFLGRKSFNKQ